jgi:hypothetical protein
MMRLSFCFAALFVLAQAVIAQTIPSFAGENLAGESVHLPTGSKTVLVIGFSKKAGDACKPWFTQVAASLKDKSQVNYYEIPVLASAPGFIRGTIIHSIRKGITPEQQKHFIAVSDHEQEWKTAAKFSGADDAYIIIVDGRGSILWQDSGQWSPAKQSTLQSEIAKL